MAIQTNNEVYTFKLCTVEYVDDEYKGMRIKVRIPPYDNNKDITREDENGIPWCFPMLPKMLHVNPKLGELVIVFCQNPESAKSQRMFFGPVVSQDYMFNYDYDFATTEKNKKSSARRLMTGSTADRAFTPYPNPEQDGENEGTLPDREDIAIRGRGNSDIILTDDETRIRCGFKISPKSDVKNRLHFNSHDLSYILMRYRNGKDKTGEFKSSVNIVGDRINLLSHDSKDYFDLGDRKELITDEQLENILNKAHELPYGDVLVDFLKTFVDVFNRHVHPYPGKAPALNAADKTSLVPDWNSMLSQSIRIN